MKKVLSLLMSLVIVLAALPLTALISFVEASYGDGDFYEGESGDFEYYVSNWDEGAMISGYTGDATELEIPSELDGIPVTGIDSGRSFNSSLISVTIPDSITYVRGGAFSGFSSLTTINVSATNKDYCSVDGVLYSKDKTALIQYPAGRTNASYAIIDDVTRIDDGAFNNCTSLENITIPDSVVSIGWDAFDNTAYYNNKVNWEDGVLYIGHHLIDTDTEYDWDTETSTTTVPNNYAIKLGTITIADSAFENCTSLESITIPDSVKSIGVGAFCGCISLESITIPDSVTDIGDCAFVDCTSLASIKIPDSVTSIGAEAFFDTAYFNNKANWEDGALYVGHHLISVNEYDYENNIYLFSNYTIKDGTITIATAAFCDSTLKSVFIPDSVTIIGDCAFKDCTSLKRITIPDSVTSIGDKAFFDCPLITSVTIPESVTSIGSEAFGYYHNEEWKIEVVKGFTIYGYEGSEAERYANENNIKIKFISIGELDVGDVNGDGKISVVDAKWILQYVAGTRECIEDRKAAADVNGDGKVSIIDAKWILQAVIGIRIFNAPVQAVPDVSELVEPTNENLYITASKTHLTVGENIDVYFSLENLSAVYGKIIYNEAFELVEAKDTSAMLSVVTATDFGEVEVASASTDTFNCCVLIVTLKYLGGYGVVSLTEFDAVNDNDDSVALEGNEIIFEAAFGSEGVTVENEDGSAFDPSVILVVKPIEPTLDEQIVNDNRITQYVAFDITLQKNEVVIQPDGNVKVYIDIPEGYDPERCAVYCLMKTASLPICMQLLRMASLYMLLIISAYT